VHPRTHARPASGRAISVPLATVNPGQPRQPATPHQRTPTSMTPRLPMIPKLNKRVRFPSSAPRLRAAMHSIALAHGLSVAFNVASSQWPSQRASAHVNVTSAMPSGKILAVDKSKTLSAYGSIQVARSEHAYFNSDSWALRATLRFGAGFTEAGAGVLLDVATD
jgi:hypothetical protein